MPDSNAPLPQAVGGARVRARTSRLVLDAARRLVEQDGLEQLSMRRLAGEAEVSVRTLYNLFGDRDGVVAALVTESFRWVHAAAVDSAAADPLERVWEAVALTVEGNCRYVPRAVVAAVVADPHQYRQLATRWRGWEIVTDAVQGAVRDGLLTDDVPADRLLELGGSALLQLLGRWAAGELEEAALRAGALHAFDVCLLAVAGPPARRRLVEHAAALAPALPPVAHQAGDADLTEDDRVEAEGP